MNEIAALLRKHRQFLVFCVIGVLNTAINFAVVVACIEGFGSNQVTANLLAFFIANIASFFANSLWNFRTPLTLGRYWRFLMSSASVVALVLAVSAAADHFGIHYLWTVVALTILSPVMSFLMVRYFAFRP